MADLPRGTMLEIVREFGLEMLPAAKETAVSRERHARYFLGPEDIEEPFSQIFKPQESSVLLAAERDEERLAAEQEAGRALTLEAAIGAAKAVIQDVMRSLT